VIAAKSLSSASEQIMSSIGAVGGRKLRAVNRLRRASRRSRLVAEGSQVVMQVMRKTILRSLRRTMQTMTMHRIQENG